LKIAEETPLCKKGRFKTNHKLQQKLIYNRLYSYLENTTYYQIINMALEKTHPQVATFASFTTD